MSALLRTDGLSVSYGGVRAVSDVQLTVAPGELVGLIGPNGAGKTTLIDAVTGFVRCTGRITFDGRDVTDLAPHRRARLGMTRTFQSLELFDDLTVAENVAASIERPTWRSTVTDLLRPRAASTAGAGGAARGRPGLDGLPDRLPAGPGPGQRPRRAAHAAGNERAGDVWARVYVLEFGVTIAEGTPDAVRRDPAVVAAYLGRTAGGDA